MSLRVPAEKPGLRVLVVDDNRDAADTLAVLLKLWGYDCRVSYDGASALNALSDYCPNCLILDINMPGMDGYTVAQKVRDEPTLARVKMIALTAYSDSTHAERIQEVGFDHHLVKPADVEELQRLLMMMEQMLQLAGDTRAILQDVQEQMSDVRDKLEDVSQEVRELKEELREVTGKTEENRTDNEENHSAS